MIPVSQSPFLQALGYAIINSLWQFALLWLVYFLVNTIIKLSSHVKYSLALMLQVIGFAWFAGTITFYYREYANIASNLTLYQNDFANAIINSASGNGAKAILFRWLINAELCLPFLSIAYLFLLMVLALKWVKSYRSTIEIKDRGLIKIDVDWRLFVQRISEQLGINKKVQIYLSEVVKTPLTIGFIKPVILIPLASINHLNTEQMEAVILHELAHIKRYDYLVNLLLSIIEAALFFNPFMQLLSKHIKRERENSCDDWVLQYEYNAATYAKALLKIATLQVAQPSFAMRATENKEVLLTRVKRMIEKNERTFYYRHQLLALLFITTVLTTVSWLSHSNKHVLAKARNTIQVKVQPLVAKVDNPLFNPVFFLANEEKEKVETPIKHEEKRLQKLIALHRLPLAVIDRESSLKLEQISTPQIEIPSTIVRNKIDVSPRTFLRFDSTVVLTTLKKLINPALLAEFERTEKEVRKSLATVSRQKFFDSKSEVEKGKAVQEIRSTLARIKATRANLESSNAAMAAVAPTTTVYYKPVSIPEEDMEPEDYEELKALVEQLKKEWKEVQNVYLTAAIENSNKNLVIPATVFYSGQVPSSYSYDYKTLTAARTYSRTITTTKEKNTAEQNERLNTNDNQKTEDQTYEETGANERIVTPAPLEAPKVKPVKKVVRIVHI